MLSTPMAGERISYVIIKGSKGQKIYEKSEDPLWVMEHNLPVDFEHYVEHQLKAPLTRIFEPVFGQAAETLLFQGNHMRTIFQHKASALNTNSLGKYTVAKEICMSCRKVLNPAIDKQDAFCQDC